MRSDRRPGWLVDLKWLSALALVACVALATAAAAAARATAPAQADGVARAVLALVLGPAGDEVEVAVGVRGYQAGGPLEILAGTRIFVDATELPAFTAEDAASRVAGVLTDRYLTHGGPPTWDDVADDVLRAHLRALDRTTLRPLVSAALFRGMHGVGIDNGTRAANWPVQAAQNPGQDVQPLVGVFVTVPTADLTGRSPRQIGERVVDGLTEILADEGAAAARGRITNPTVGASFEAAVEGPVRHAVHAALATAMSAYEGEIAARIADARAVLAGAHRSEDPWAGVLEEAELVGLTAAARADRVQAVLARRLVTSGHGGVLELVRDAGVRDRLSTAAPVVDAVSLRAHQRYLGWAWILGGASLLLLVIVVLVSSGPGRALWPGLCLLVAAGPGLALALVWRDLAPVVAWPAGPLAEGAVASLWHTGRLVAGTLAGVAAEPIVWVYLLVAGTGAALVLMAGAAFLAAQLRPRRRSLI